MNRGSSDPPEYALGHSDRELDRLSAQARLVDAITRQFFQEAGIVRGMRVLDIGSGAGDVAILLAALVGDEGAVVGVDRAPSAIARARANTRSNVVFVEGDPTAMTFDRPFDAIVGRYVLQFHPNPAEMLQRVAVHVKPGGIVAFHELDWKGVGSFPASPTYDRCCRWIVAALQELGAETRMGIKLHSAFLAAGLPSPTLRLSAAIGGGVNAAAQVTLVTDLVATLLPAMERLGVATRTEVDVDTLFERISHEVTSAGTVICGRSEVGAWAQIAAAH